MNSMFVMFCCILSGLGIGLCVGAVIAFAMLIVLGKDETFMRKIQQTIDVRVAKRVAES